VRSLLGHGLLRAGRLLPAELPGVLERVARSFVNGDEGALLTEELAFEASCWPRGALARAVRAEALQHDELVPLSVARFAALDATPRDAMLLGLRAFTDETLDAEPVASWGLLARPSGPALDAIEDLVRAWIPEPLAATATMRFRALRVLLEHGRTEPPHDALLSSDLLAWAGDLSASPRCGLCGDAHVEAALPHEPSTAVVQLLFQLPTERALRFLDRASPAHSAVSQLLRRWLGEGREAFRIASKAHATALEALPEEVRRAMERAGARLAVSEDGHLPRLQQHEVLVSFAPSSISTTDEPQPLALRSMLRHQRARVSRLLELNAPLVVLMRDASRLRTIERLLSARGTEPEDVEDVDDELESLAVRREIALSQVVLRELARGAPTLDAAMAQLERLRLHGGDDAPNAAAQLEARDGHPPDALAAAGHFAFCALDRALGDHVRTDQDALYDVAERAMSLGRRREVGSESGDHVALDADERRAWWLRWLRELVPEVLRAADAHSLRIRN
jgi:hypothetical protein